VSLDTQHFDVHSVVIFYKTIVIQKACSCSPGLKIQAFSQVKRLISMSTRPMELV